mmetsp:Transcript_33027/g.84657  ORF Transcript_33027/g.84657 Transcript_33027/m.84657 type:complete len:530 (-) Transcript_33027:644-2233(-)|eukprot:CAMPEP_0174924274 /NCGR_PEP_ID=MMETSP1355-20121228/7138_1 /TAXON_ID=464990 /ORGANISM="Hemiselmis tepida, Strain CCMP443" /LENGTH=529 /DNA_ID=CAMNT_0016170057 /DNA_START=22 /DNA_END=1611 /DNA_ORIENTATION=+
MTDEVKVASDQTTAALMEEATKKRLVVIAEMRRFVKLENAKQYPQKLLSDLTVTAPMGGIGWLPEGLGDKGKAQAVDEVRPKAEQKRSKSRIEVMCDDIMHGRARDEGAGDDSSMFDHHQFSANHDHPHAAQDGGPPKAGGMGSFASAHEPAKRKGEGAARAGSPGGAEKRAWGRPSSTSSQTRTNRKAPAKGVPAKAPGGKSQDPTEPINKFMRGMSTEERELVAKVFRFIDINGDGTLEFQEIKDAFRTVGVQVTSRDLDGMIAEVDSDGDGTIDLKEFITMVGMAKLGLVGGGLGGIVFEKLRSLLDLARVKEDRERSAAGLPPSEVLGRKATQSKSFKEKQKIAVHNDTMLLDWRTDDEKRRIMRDQREKMRRGARDTLKGKAASLAIAERKKKLEALSKGPKVTLVPVSRPSLLEGTDVPSPRYVPKWSVRPSTSHSHGQAQASAPASGSASRPKTATSSNSGARASTPPIPHGGMSPPSVHPGRGGGVDGDNSPVPGLAHTARPSSAAGGGPGGPIRPGTSAL